MGKLLKFIFGVGLRGVGDSLVLLQQWVILGFTADLFLREAQDCPQRKTLQTLRRPSGGSNRNVIVNPRRQRIRVRTKPQ